jgi:DNA-directed RNA polymerase alpha subunit
MKQFIIESLLKTQVERTIDVVFNRQKHVFGFGENKMTVGELAQKYGCCKQTINNMCNKNKDKVQRNIKSLLALANKPVVIKEVDIKTVERDVPSTEILVASLDLSVRSINCLYNDGIRTVDQLTKFTQGEMLRIPNFGRKSLKEVSNKLDRLGLSFAAYNSHATT